MPKLHQGAAARNATRGRGAFTRLSNDVVRDPALGPVDLALLAYRLTFITTKSRYGIRPRAAAAALRTGQDRITAALKRLQTEGYLEREMRRKKGPGGRFVTSAFDAPTRKALADPLNEGTSRFLKRSWFGHLSVEATALWLFFRARTARGPVRWANDIKARFPKWGSVRLRRYLGELKDAGLIEYIRLRQEDGTFGQSSSKVQERCA
jgi:hypothetical protein